MADINRSDIKLVKSQRLDETIEGGGQMTSNEVVDGSVNDLFPDLSRLDKTYGRVAMRKAFMHVQTTDTSTYLGAHAILSEDATDPEVSVIMVKGDSFNKRPGVVNYLNKNQRPGAQYNWILYGNHYKGSKTLTVWNTTIDKIGTISRYWFWDSAQGHYRSYTVEPEDLSLFIVSPYGQTVYTIDMYTEAEQFTVGVATYQKSTFILKEELKMDMEGYSPNVDPSVPPPSPSTLTYKSHKSVYVSEPSYYSVSSLATLSVIGDKTITVDAYKKQLIPVVGEPAPPVIADTSFGTGTSVLLDYISPEIMISVNLIGTYTYLVSGEINSVEIIGLTISGSDILYGSTTIGDIDYSTGGIRITNVSYQGDYTVVFTSKYSVGQNTHSDIIYVDSSNQNYVYSYETAPKAQNVKVQYVANETPYEIISSGGTVGKGTLNNGLLTIVLDRLPDIGSEILIQWSSVDSAVGVSPENKYIHKFSTHSPITAPNMGTVLGWVTIETDLIRFSSKVSAQTLNCHGIKLEYISTAHPNYDDWLSDVGGYSHDSVTFGELCPEGTTSIHKNAVIQGEELRIKFSMTLTSSFYVQTETTHVEDPSDSDYWFMDFDPLSHNSDAEYYTGGIAVGTFYARKDNNVYTDSSMGIILKNGVPTAGRVNYPKRELIGIDLGTSVDWLHYQPSIVNSENLFLTASSGEVTGTLAELPKAGSIYFTFENTIVEDTPFYEYGYNKTFTYEVRDNGAGDLVISSVIVGSINYGTGAFTLTVDTIESINVDAWNWQYTENTHSVVNNRDLSYIYVLDNVRTINVSTVFSGKLECKYNTVENYAANCYLFFGGVSSLPLSEGTYSREHKSVFPIDTFPVSGKLNNQYVVHDQSVYDYNNQGGDSFAIVGLFSNDRILWNYDAEVPDISSDTVKAFPVTDYVSTVSTVLEQDIAQQTVVVKAYLKDSTLLEAGSAYDGSIIDTGIVGYVNHETGVVTVHFGEWVTDDATAQGSVWYNASVNDSSGNVWKPHLVSQITIQYQALSYGSESYETSLLLESVLGLNPINFPKDGKVPIFKRGDVAVIHHSETLVMTSPSMAAGAVYDVGRNPVSAIDVYDDTNLYVPDTHYTLDLDNGTITMSDPLNLSGYTEPLRAVHRIESTTVIRQVNGTQLKLLSPLTFDFPATTTKVSSAMLAQDLFAHTLYEFDQLSWDNTWEDYLVGDPASASYDFINHPIELTNYGTVTERWAIFFTSSTTIRVIGENLGIIYEGAISTDIAPVNSITGGIYFTMRDDGFGTGWSAGNLIRFNTIGATLPIWFIRTTKQAPLTEPSDHFTLLIRGDSN